MYRRNLPHLQKSDAPHFVTFRTRTNLILNPAARDLVLQHCLRENNHRVDLHAGVVMPTHVHLIFTPLRNVQGESYTLAEIMNAIKGASAHSVNKLLNRKGSLWLDESFDRVLRSSDDLDHKILYLVANPVRSRLAMHPDQYPWLWREGTQPRAAVPHGS
jgi:REP element-mobilizing transposase RayT